MVVQTSAGEPKFRDLTIRVTDEFVRLLHLNAQLKCDEDVLDAAGVLARVVSQVGMGIHPDVIYLSVPHEWRDCVEAKDT